MRIAIIGTGNVAYHFAKRLTEFGHPPVIIASRTFEKGQIFTRSLNLQTEIITDGCFLNKKLDFVMIAVPDREIQNVIEQYVFDEDSVLLHASGAQPMAMLKGKTSHFGVLYPFQTFSKAKSVDFDEIPILIEGNSSETEEKILKLATLLGPKIHRINSEQRLKVHLAAVFASNFTNYMFYVAENILQDSGIMLSDFKHLMEETVEKAIEISPKEAQTGPAIRGDEEVLQKHQALLANAEDLKELYQLISNQIAKMRNG